MTAVMVSLLAAALAGRLAAALLLPVAGPERIDALRAAPRPVRPGSGPTPVALVGRRVRTAFGRPPDPAADRRAGVGTALVLVAAVLDPALAVAALGPLVLLPRWRRVRARRSSAPEGSIEADLPDLVDLLGLTVGAGLTVPTALPLLARWGPPSVRAPLAEAVRALAAGVSMIEVLDHLAGAWGEPAQPLVRALRDHVRHGTPLGPTLDRIGVDARGRRRRAAETRARRLPVLLLFPLVLCTLPAFGLLTVAPIVAGTLRSLDGERLEASASPELRTEEPPCTAFSSTPTSRPIWPPCRSPTAPVRSPPIS